MLLRGACELEQICQTVSGKNNFSRTSLKVSFDSKNILKKNQQKPYNNSKKPQSCIIIAIDIYRMLPDLSSGFAKCPFQSLSSRSMDRYLLPQNINILIYYQGVVFLHGTLSARADVSCISMHSMCSLPLISPERFLESEWCLHLPSAAKGQSLAATSQSQPQNDVPTAHVALQTPQKTQPNLLSREVSTRVDVDKKTWIKKAPSGASQVCGGHSEILRASFRTSGGQKKAKQAWKALIPAEIPFCAAGASPVPPLSCLCQPPRRRTRTPARRQENRASAPQINTGEMNQDVIYILQGNHDRWDIRRANVLEI